VELAEDVASLGGRIIGSVQWTCCSEYTVKEAYLCLSEDHVDMVDGVKDVWNPLVNLLSCLGVDRISYAFVFARFSLLHFCCRQEIEVYGQGIILAFVMVLFFF
jgi:hypothetical protein